jgi:hypothetical protein
MSTTIQQQAGSILLEVEKRNVKHFEVETPYLAAVVKGTHFRVSVNAASTSVEVSRGKVEVSDFRTGQIAQVTPGQVATSFTRGKSGLTLSGAGPFKPIEQGKPRASSIERVPVPKGGLAAPSNGAKGYITHALAHISPTGAQHQQLAAQAPRAGAVRISTAIGEIRLNVQKATHGLAHGSVPPASINGAHAKGSYATIWSDTQSSGRGNSGQAGSNNAGGNAAAAAAATSASTISGVAASVAAVTAAGSDSGNGNGNGNAATGNGKGNSQSAGNNGNGNNGNGNGYGHGNGNGHGNGH